MNNKRKGNTHGLNFKKMPKLRQNGGGISESVVMRLVEKQNTRTRKDVGSWRGAIKQAESVARPRRTLLYDLFDDLILDNHMASLRQTRIQRVLAMPFRVVNKTSREEDPEKTRLLEKAWFYKCIELGIDATFYGYSLIEFQDTNEEGEFTDVKLVPRRHVLPEQGVVLIEPNDDKGIEYRDTPLMRRLVEIGEYKDLGLLNKAAPQILFKKNAQSAWAEYCEIFGMPMRVGKTNTRNTSDLDRMADALKNMAQGAYAVMDLTEDISFVESTKGDAYNVYDKLITRANSEMSKLTLGQTMTTDVGENGSRAQAEVHAEQGDYIFIADLRKVKHFVNTDVFRVLIENGYQLDGFEFEWNENNVVSEAEWNIDSGLLEHFEIDPKYFMDKYGVPITGVKNKAQVPENTPQNQPDNNTPQAKKGAETKKTAPEKKKLRLTQLIEALYGDSTTTLSDSDIGLEYSDWMGTIETFLQNIHSGKIKPQELNEALFWHTAKEINKGARKGDKKGFIEVDFTTPDYNYRNQVRRNLFAFAGAKTYQQLAELNNMLLDAQGKPVPFNEFKKKVAEYRTEAMKINTRYNTSWLQSEYDTALNQSQANARWQELLNNTDLRPHGEYKTIGDSKVAEPCLHLNGVVQPLSGPWFKKYSPLNHFKCRCRIVGTDKPITNNPPTPPIPPGFSGNAFDLGYIITPQHPYFDMDSETLKAVTGRGNEFVQNRYIETQKQTYNQLGGDYVKNSFNKETGGYHAAHKNAGPLDTDEEAIVNFMVNEGFGVVRPEYVKENYRRNYDADINGAKFDFKTTTASTKSAVEDLIRGAKGQANSIILQFKADLKASEVIRAMYNKMGKNSPVNTLLIVYKNKLATITKADILQKRVEDIIKTIAGE